MKYRLASITLLACFGAHAQSLEIQAQTLSDCVVSYADSQINTVATPQAISAQALSHCETQLNALHDSIGPDAAQWNVLAKSQQQAVTTIRGQTVEKIREGLSAQIESFITDKRAESEPAP